MSRRHTIVLADDHVVVAQALAHYLQDEFDLLEIVDDGAKLIGAARRLRPDVIVSDLAMPVLGGIEALRRLKAEGSAAKVILLTMHADAHLASEALRAGASGYLLKNSAGDELITAIKQVLQGNVYISPLVAGGVVAAMSKPQAKAEPRLTPRQREVLRFVAEGMTMKEVAAALNLSPRTVETHKYEMMDALGVKSTAELVQYAVRQGVLAPP